MDVRPLGECIILALYIRIQGVGLHLNKTYHLQQVMSLGTSAPWEPQLQWLEVLVALKEGGLCPILLEEESGHICLACWVGCSGLEP